ncbi:MAG: hypothetical protein AAF821_18930 [Cyanobacteria bacterium P01_D01_bin.156]
MVPLHLQKVVLLASFEWVAGYRFDGQTALTQGEFVSYLSQLINASTITFLTFSCGINSAAYIAMELSLFPNAIGQELQQMAERLNIAIQDIQYYQSLQ